MPSDLAGYHFYTQKGCEGVDRLFLGVNRMWGQKLQFQDHQRKIVPCNASRLRVACILDFIGSCQDVIVGRSFFLKQK